MLEKVQKASRQDATSQPQSSTGTPTGLISESQLQPLAPVPVPLSLSSSSSTLAPASAQAEAPPEPLTLSEPEKEAMAECKPSANTEMNLSREHTVKRACYGCGNIAPYIGHQSHNPLCLLGAHNDPLLMCTGCGTPTVRRANICVKCNRKFEMILV